MWDKNYHLFAHVDEERERFLDFERWWTGFYRLSREEIVATVENLFIGNKLERHEMQVCPGCIVDLRQIRNPLVIFASSGDNITPPHQALNWIPVVYPTTEELKAAGQRIVYLLNTHVGHLGIFVSASVAKMEHRAILESLDDLEALEPGLYEMKIINPTGDPDCHKPQYSVAFQERRVEDIHFEYPREAFEKVRQASDFNETIYRSFISPGVQAITTPWGAELLKTLHPMRTRRYLFSEKFSPWMAGIKALAPWVREQRRPVAEDNPYVELEKQVSQQISQSLDNYRHLRDHAYEMLFKVVYG